MKDNHLIDMSEDNLDLGKVEISPEVIEVIAGLAASEIDGVATMRGNFASGVAERLGRKASHGKGVKVDLQEDGITVEVYVTTNYGASIPDVCKKVQENIYQTLKSMTAIELSGVNVHVVGVQLEVEKKEEPVNKEQ
ncbi:Asp23/Gls24 family envelope stress response protein [Alteribacter populi]|uniref:Asp23/Gls24 family envelope stress response protein n=1 Tax=Alteribacter populi TaxID=2011011 RepID=UPI0012FE34A5|nr:Asp23/Gls24 family envelope stress response protein [Alteribacter populi]